MRKKGLVITAPELYRTYTRQASNFVFPYINAEINGEGRPRPGKYRLNEKTAEQILQGKLNEQELSEFLSQNERDAALKYIEKLNEYLESTEEFFFKIKEQHGRKIEEDLEEFKTGFKEKYQGKFLNFHYEDKPRSELFKEMYNCSPKMTCIAFMAYQCPGKLLIYSNYVLVEGIDIMKLYLRLVGFNDYHESNDFFGYCEYHGRVSKQERNSVKDMYNQRDNTYGKFCKVILLSPSGVEGIQLLSIREIHICEPYWNETRQQQIIGRGVRQCSHKYLPMNERIVNIYRYKAIKPDELNNSEADVDTLRESTDEHIESLAKAKDNLLQSFLSAIKEAAVDCELFRNHNMMSQSYSCFNFPLETIESKNPGPAYKEDIKDDIKYDSGLNAKNTRVLRIKAIKIKAVYTLPDGTYSSPEPFLFYPKTRTVYDSETHYAIGTVALIDDTLDKLDKDTYIISDIIDIPDIQSTLNV